MTLKEHAATAAWVAAGLVCVVMMQTHAAANVGGAVTRGLSSAEAARRRLAGDSEYDQALRTISTVFGESTETSNNGIAGPVQLIVSTALVLVLGSLAAGAGIGGGGLFVPIYMALLGAGPKGAVPLSKATILGGAIGNFISIGPARHPKAKRPLIDYEASTLMQSGELLGVVFGVLLNNLLPAIVIVVFLVLILTWNSVRTLKKAMAIRKKETAAMKAPARQAPDSATTSTTKEVELETPKEEAGQVDATDVKVEEVRMYGSMVHVENGTATELAAKVSAADADAPPKPSAELEAILAEEEKQYPFWAWSMLIPMTAFTLGYAFVKNAIKNADDCSEVGFWLWYVTPVPVLGGFMVATAILLGKRHKRKQAAGFEYLPADMQWNTETLKKFPKTAILAGITAGLLGIGGGMVIGPLFLQIGMEPQVGTSSCAFMILWTAFSGVVIYGVDDHLGAELAIWCVSFGFISGQIGQRLVNTVLKKTGRPSYVVFLLGSIIGAACIAMFCTLISKMAAGDFDANDIVEVNETASTHLFYLGSGFGCAADDDGSSGNSTA